MLSRRTRLMLVMLPLVFVAGACADRAENAMGQAALNRQLNRAHRPDSTTSAAVESAAPMPGAANPEAVPVDLGKGPAAVRPESTRPESARPAAVHSVPVRSAPAREPATTTQGATRDVPAEQPAAAETTQPAPSTSRPGAAETPGGGKAASVPTAEPVPVPVARAPRTVAMTVPIGTVLSVSLDQELSTRNAQAGDPFTTTLQEPFVEGSVVLLPAGAVIHGRVTAAQQSTRVGRTAVLKLAFDSVSFDGRSYPLSATVMEANPERRSRSNTTETAGKIAAGAAAGALLGRILGKDTKSTVAGAAMGAAAGTAIALGTQDVDAVLPKDSRMVIRLDRSVAVEVRVP